MSKLPQQQQHIIAKLTSENRISKNKIVASCGEVLIYIGTLVLCTIFEFRSLRDIFLRRLLITLLINLIFVLIAEQRAASNDI